MLMWTGWGCGCGANGGGGLNSLRFGLCGLYWFELGGSGGGGGGGEGY